MNADKIFNVFGTLVALATITVLVTNGAGTAQAANGVFGGFGNALRIAMGRG